MLNKKEYAQQVVIVTGAAKGIGRCIGETYALQGAYVVVADINKDLGNQVAKQISATGHKAISIPTDVSKPNEIVALMQRTQEIFGAIHILINNAGISKTASPYELTIEDWDQVINTNLRSAFLCSREAAKIMKRGGKGSIVNIASTRAFMSEKNSEAYAASKGGIVALTHALAASFSADGIQVNSISPGWIETENWDDLQGADHEQHWSRRVGRPEDVANACLFLTNSENNFVNGTNLIIDGGMTKKMIYH